MRVPCGLLGGLFVAFHATLNAGTIQGEYLEARSCDVYTGPCFANAEMDLAGKEALMAWKVGQGTWNGVEVGGLSVAVVAHSQRTMGNTGVFPMRAGAIRSVVLVDDRANDAQRLALIDFVKVQAREFTGDVATVIPVSISLENDHDAGTGRFQAGEIASIETRALTKGDCVCTNEMIFYQPLTKIRGFVPGYALTHSYTGEGLDTTWTMHHQRSAFMGRFKR